MSSCFGLVSRIVPSVTRTAVLSAGLMMAVGIPGPAVAQNENDVPVYGDDALVYLSEGFLPDPYVLDVLAGGQVESENEDCPGYFPEEPSVAFFYPSNGGSNLFIYAEGDSGLVLYVDDLEGARCDEDRYGATHPLVALDDPQGAVLSVYVGTYDGATSPARLYVSERDPRAASPDGKQGTYGDLGWVELDEAFLPDPYNARVAAGGSASDERCGYGFVSDEPTFFVDYFRSSVDLRHLYIYAHSDADITLRIESDTGEVFCNDDGLSGTDPLVVVPTDGLAEGSFLDVYVGSYLGGTADAILNVSERDPRSVGLVEKADAQVQAAGMELEEGFFPDPRILNVVAGGGVSGDAAGCGAFGGFFPEVSNAWLNYDPVLGGEANLYVYAESETDLTLRVESSDGTYWCNDDGYSGTNPLIVIPAAESSLPNAYDVYVGTYDPGAAPAVLYISETDPRENRPVTSLPNPRLRATDGGTILEPGFLPDPYRFDGIVPGGSVAVVSAACDYGFVPDAPHVDVRYAGAASGHDLYVFAQGAQDTTLLIRNSAGEWFCDDDGRSGHDPLVVLPDASGDYSIWLGTYDPDEGDAPATIFVSEKDPRQEPEVEVTLPPRAPGRRPR